MSLPYNNLVIVPASVEEVKKESAPHNLHFIYFPAYAQFLLENKVYEFAAEQLNLSREIQLPLLKFFEGHSEKELMEIGIEDVQELLSFCAQNRAGEYIETSVQKWLANQLPVIKRNQVSIEDISLISFMRRKIFRHLIPSYTLDINLYVQLMDEIDKFTVTLDSVCFKAFVEIQQQKGTPAEMFETFQDATIQKLNKSELDEKRNFIQKIADVIPCLITVYNIHTGKYIFINDALRKLLGYDPKEVINKGVDFFAALIHPDDLELIMKKNSIILESADQLSPGDNEPLIEFKYRLKHENGGYRWFQTFGTVFNRNRENKIEDLINISIDVTEESLLNQKLVMQNEEIRKSEERYHRMISEVEDYAILLLDRNGFIQNWNKGAEKIKGYKAEEIIGKNFRSFYTKEDRESKLPEKLITEALKNGKAKHEGWRVRKDGTKFWGSVLITALHDENDNVLGFSKVTRDLTERKLREDQLQEYADTIAKNNEELKKINKELDSFAYMASHDLQEPLRKIRTFCNLILNKGKEQLPPETSEYFSRIISAAERMQKLIEALLNYSRTNTMEIIYEPTDLNGIVAGVQKDLSEVISAKKARIELNKLPVIQAVPLQFHQLFLNIIENSIKYSRKNVPPVIKISAELVPEKNNSFSTAAYFYKITIADNGIGFEQEYAENIFKLFQRLHGQNEYSGTGVGLAICKKIVENHNGIITATGKPDKGATFTVLLPAE